MNKKKFMFFYFIPVFIVLLLADQSDKSQNIRGSLEGTVYNESGQPVSGTKVTIKGIGYSSELRTDGQGRFKAKDLAAGVYEIGQDSSNPELVVKKEAAIHLGKETFVTLVTRSGRPDGTPGIIARPVYVRDTQGKVLHQEIQIEDKFYSMDYTYDAQGRVSTARDNSNKEWRYEYTASGKIEKVTRPDKTYFLYNYNTAGDLWKIDLPWGYKIFYTTEANQYTKAVRKYKDLILFEFTYTLDNKGNKIKVEEKGGNKLGFEYKYDENNRPKEIKDLRTGEKNSDVYEYKGKVRDAAFRGDIALKNNKYEDKHWEYEFDDRENIIHQKEKKSGLEVRKEYKNRNLLIRENYLYRSSPVLAVEYGYDTFDRLVMKTLDNGIRYYYYRDEDGHLIHKIVKNMATREEYDALVYTPFHSEIDQDGFELVQYKDKEKLFILDAEGNKRYKLDITDVLRFSTHLLRRDVHTDGDAWGEAESVMSMIAKKLGLPGGDVADYLTDFYDLPLKGSYPSGIAGLTIQTRYVGCYWYYWDEYWWEWMPFCDNWWDSCVDCGYGGEYEPGGYLCSSTMYSPSLLQPYVCGSFEVSTDCPNIWNFWWTGGWECTGNYSPVYVAYWDESAAGTSQNVQVRFDSSYTYDTGSTVWQTTLDSWVFIEAAPPPPPPPPPPPENPIIKIQGVNTPSGNNSFIANRNRTGDQITMTATATQGTSDISDQIAWTCDGTISAASFTGATFSFVPNPSSAPLGRNERLCYQVWARITINNQTYEDTVIIQQDYLDGLRQEYEDLPGRDSVPRAIFDKDSPAYTELLGPAAESSKHDNWHILATLNMHAVESNLYYCRDHYADISFQSGYRCPVGNLDTPGASQTSNHQYGRAFDFAQYSSNANYYVYEAAREAQAAADTYLRGSNGVNYHWYQYPANPPAQGVTFQKGHAAWEY